jgi:hypothetical protein
MEIARTRGPVAHCHARQRGRSTDHRFLSWAAFILSRPLGATLGDLFDKPTAQGGFEVCRFTATAILFAAMVALILLARQRPGAHPGSASDGLKSAHLNSEVKLVSSAQPPSS